MLYATGSAGDPLEYLNNKWMTLQLQSNPAADPDFNVDRFLGDWEKRRTSPNGVFGIKLHYYQMRRVWRGNDRAAARYLGGYDHRILLSRRDKIAQAVSLYRAITTQIWSSRDLQYSDNSHAHEKNNTVNFDASRIAKLMALLTKEEERWRSFMQTHELSFSELCYEDFLEDYAGQSLRLLKLLGIELKDESIPPPQLKRQSQDDDPMIEQFKKTVGLRAGTNAPCDRDSA